MASEPLSADEAAERLGIAVKDLMRLALRGTVRYVLVDEVARFPDDAVEGCRQHLTSHPIEAEPLWAHDAAERLGIPIKELLRLALYRKIRYVMVDGIVHLPEEALDEYQRRQAG